MYPILHSMLLVCPSVCLSIGLSVFFHTQNDDFFSLKALYQMLKRNDEISSFPYRFLVMSHNSIRGCLMVRPSVSLLVGQSIRQSVTFFGRQK